MENKKFKNVSFSLRRNTLHSSKIDTLEKIVMISLVSHFFNAPDIMDDLNELILSKRRWMISTVDFQQKIIRKITGRINNCFHSNIKDLKIYHMLIKVTTHSVVPEVCNFIVVSKINSTEDMKIIIKNLVLTVEGTVNTKATIQKIVISEMIPTESKFSLAVRFFLGYDYVEKFYNGLSEIDKSSIKQKLSLENDICLYFWMWQITGSREKLKSKINGHIISESGEHRVCESDENDDVALQHIFQKAAEQYNEMGVQYLWNNFILNMGEKELILKDLLPRYTKRPEHHNILMYLIFQLNENELSDYFTMYGYYIIDNLVLKPRWKKVFFKVFDILKPYVDDEKHAYILRKITTKYYKVDSLDISIDFIQKFFNEMPISAKQNLVNESSSSKFHYMLLLLHIFKAAEIDLAKLFITHCNKTHVLNFFLSSNGLKLMEISFEKKHFEFIHTVMKEITTSNQEISQIKSAIFESKAFSLGKTFLLHSQNLELFDKLITWCSDSVAKERISLFKKNLPFINKGEIIRVLLFHPMKNPTRNRLKYINEVLLWCLQNKNNVEIAKRKILLHIHQSDSYDEKFKITCYEEVKTFVLRHEWVYLRTLINWIKYSTAGKKALGEKLLNDESLLMVMIKQNDVCNTLKSFVYFLEAVLSIKYFGGINAFKLKILKHYLFSNFVLKGKFNVAKILANWCNPSEKMLKEFKTMTYHRLTEISDLAYTEELEDFFLWLNPSLST